MSDKLQFVVCCLNSLSLWERVGRGLKLGSITNYTPLPQPFSQREKGERTNNNWPLTKSAMTNSEIPSVCREFPARFFPVASNDKLQFVGHATSNDSSTRTKYSPAALPGAA